MCVRLWNQVRMGTSLVLVCFGVQLALADVVDFSHLLDDIEFALEEETTPQRNAPPVQGRDTVDTVLASRIAELEQLLEVRERQISELKQALEEVTTEYSSRIADMRAEREREVGGRALALLQEALDTTSQELEEAQQERDALAAAKVQAISDLEQMRQEEISALETMRTESMSVLLAEHEAALGALAEEHTASVASMESEHKQTVATLEEQHAAAMSALRAEHEEQIGKLASEHTATVASLQKAQETLLADTVRDREDARRLRGEVSRLEAALRVAQAENERERFLLAYNSGSLFMAAGRYDRAERDLLRALSIREDDAALHYNLGVLYDEHLRQPAKARRHYERFLELAPNDRDAPLVMQWLRELR